MNAVRTFSGTSNLQGFVNVVLSVNNTDKSHIALDRDHLNIKSFERFILIQGCFHMFIDISVRHIA